MYARHKRLLSPLNILIINKAINRQLKQYWKTHLVELSKMVSYETMKDKLNQNNSYEKPVSYAHKDIYEENKYISSEYQPTVYTRIS